MTDSRPLLPRVAPDSASRPHSSTPLSAFPFVDPSAWVRVHARHRLCSERRKADVSVSAAWTTLLNQSTVDDRVRGGSSQSYLEPLTGSKAEGGVALSDSTHGVRFYGTLGASSYTSRRPLLVLPCYPTDLVFAIARTDIKTLGGAGFASQSYTFPPDAPLAISPTSSAGVRLHFFASSSSSAPSSEKAISHRPETLTFILKTAPPPAQRPDGRLEATLSYEAHVVAPLRSGGYVDLPWSAFEPTYRGKPQKDAPALDPREIKAIGLMCRSDFGAQEGPFDFLIAKVEPMRRRSGWLDRLRAAFAAFFARCRSWIRC
jgi:hypothetical protein